MQRIVFHTASVLSPCSRSVVAKNMCSDRAAFTTARPSRDEDYKLILPAIPSGTVALNTVFLHADPVGRPYNVGHFGDALRDKVVRNDVTSVGPFVYNHLWALTFNSAAAREKLLSLGEVTVKGRRCLIIDPHKKELRVRIHWLPQHVPDEAIVASLERFGSVTDITREKWKDSFFTGAETTTRGVTITLKGGVAVDDIPHLLFVCGCQVLVAVPGRPPLCLRCKAVGHIRKQCRTPWCKTCRRFGHEDDECVATYASKLRPQQESSNGQLGMELGEGGDIAAGTAVGKADGEVASGAEAEGADAEALPRETCRPVTEVEPSPGPGAAAAAPSGGAAASTSCIPEIVQQKLPKEDEDDSDSWLAPRRKKGRRSPPATMPAKIVEVGHSELDDIGFLSA